MPNDQDNSTDQPVNPSQPFGNPIQPVKTSSTQPFGVNPTEPQAVVTANDMNPPQQLNSIQPVNNQPPTPTIVPEPVATTTPPITGSGVFPLQSTPMDTTTTGDVSPLAYPSSPAAKNGKKKWIIGGAIAIVLALIGGASAFAYTMYQNPEKVVLDGMVNMISVQPGTVNGSLAAVGDDGKFTAKLLVKSDDKQVNGSLKFAVNVTEGDVKLEGSADFAAESNGNGYIKINDVDKLAETAVDALIDFQIEQTESSSGLTITPQEAADAKKQTLVMFEPFINKVNNKWIKFAADEESSTSEEQKCATDVLKKIQKDKKIHDEIASAYKDNKFIVIKDELGVKNGSYGYVLDVDNDKSKSFGKALEATTLGKELKKCSDDTETGTEDFNSDSDSSDGSSTRVEVWVSQWSHQITGINIKYAPAKDDTNTYSVDGSLVFDYSSVSGLTVPKDAIDSEELMQEIQGLMFGGASAPTGSSSI